MIRVPPSVLDGGPARRSGLRRAVPVALPLVGAVVVGSLLLALAVVPGSGAPSPNAPGDGRGVASGPLHADPPLGVYGGPGALAKDRAFSRWLGRPLSAAMDFLDGSSWQSITHPQAQLAPWSGSKLAVIWGLPMLPSDGASLAVGATGAYDDYFKTVAAALVEAGQGHAMFRIGWEFNGRWFPWSAQGNPAAFVDYWRHIVGAMRSVRGAAFRFVWNPARGDLGAGDLGAYYPGDQFVSDIGLDVYDVAVSYASPAAAWRDAQSGPYGLDWAAGFAASHHKPFVLPEWGVWNDSGGSGGGDDPAFVDATAHYLATHRVALFVVWDFGASRLGDSLNPRTTVEFRRDFGG